jgi:hypothetical protein
LGHKRPQAWLLDHLIGKLTGIVRCCGRNERTT